MKSFIILAAFFMTVMAQAGSLTVNLAWDASLSTDVTGYKLFRSTVVGGPYTLVKSMPNALTTSDLVAADGKYCYVLTAFDAAANESPYSNEVCATVDTTAPAAVKNLRIL